MSEVRIFEGYEAIMGLKAGVEYTCDPSLTVDTVYHVKGTDTYKLVLEDESLEEARTYGLDKEQ